MADIFKQNNIVVIGIIICLNLFSCQESKPKISSNTDLKNKSKIVDSVPTEENKIKYIQQRIDDGETPKMIIDSGILLDSLYGKTYMDGLIFHLNKYSGTGFVTTKKDLNNDNIVTWGCKGLDIKNLNNIFWKNAPDVTKVEGGRKGDGMINTNAILANCEENGIAAKLCRNLGNHWFLPSVGELKLMHTNLFSKNKGNLRPLHYYWSSTEFDSDNVYTYHFDENIYSYTTKDNSYLRVRAVKAF